MISHEANGMPKALGYTCGAYHATAVRSTAVAAQLQYFTNFPLGSPLGRLPKGNIVKKFPEFLNFLERK